MRIASLALLFLAAQFAPGLHAFFPHEEIRTHCTDGTGTTHFCACTVDHHLHPCPICSHAFNGSSILDAPCSETRLFRTQPSPTPRPEALQDEPVLCTSAPRGPPSPTV